MREIVRDQGVPCGRLRKAVEARWKAVEVLTAELKASEEASVE